MCRLRCRKTLTVISRTYFKLSVVLAGGALFSSIFMDLVHARPYCSDPDRVQSSSSSDSCYIEYPSIDGLRLHISLITVGEMIDSPRADSVKAKLIELKSWISDYRLDGLSFLFNARLEFPRRNNAYCGFFEEFPDGSLDMSKEVLLFNRNECFNKSIGLFTSFFMTDLATRETAGAFQKILLTLHPETEMRERYTDLPFDNFAFALQYHGLKDRKSLELLDKVVPEFDAAEWLVVEVPVATYKVLSEGSLSQVANAILDRGYGELYRNLKADFARVIWTLNAGEIRKSSFIEKGARLFVPAAKVTWKRQELEGKQFGLKEAKGLAFQYYKDTKAPEKFAPILLAVHNSMATFGQRNHINMPFFENVNELTFVPLLVRSYKK